MINEITKIIEDQDTFTGSTVLLDDKGNRVTQMKVIKADTFVEDGFYAENLLLEDILKGCIEQNNVTDNIKRQLPEGVSKVVHYSSLIELSKNLAQQIIYNNTKKFIPNYVICSGDVLPLFVFAKGYKSQPTAKIEGVFKAGMLGNIVVFVAPGLDRGQMLWGVKDDYSPSIVTFKNEEGKICSKIINNDCFALVKIED